eukprot:364563-Chlamydomonas_euryale.AAC.5
MAGHVGLHPFHEMLQKLSFTSIEMPCRDGSRHAGCLCVWPPDGLSQCGRTCASCSLTCGDLSWCGQHLQHAHAAA